MPAKLAAAPGRFIRMAGKDDFAELARKFRALAQDTRDAGLRAEFLRLAEECQRLQEPVESALLMAQGAIRE